MKLKALKHLHSAPSDKTIIYLTKNVDFYVEIT